MIHNIDVPCFWVFGTMTFGMVTFHIGVFAPPGKLN